MDDTEPWVAATALMGVHRALIDDTRRRIVSGTNPRRLSADVSAQADKALSRLGDGLADYAIKQALGAGQTNDQGGEPDD